MTRTLSWRPLCAAALCAACCASVQPAGAQLVSSIPTLPRSTFEVNLSLTGGVIAAPTPAPSSLVVSPLTFSFTPVGNLASMLAGTQGPAQQALGLQVVGGFVEAADVWRSVFADPITVNIDINFGPLGDGTLGGALSQTGVVFYQDVATAMTLDIESVADVIAVGSLQPGAELSFITNDTSFNNSPNPSPRVLDNDVNYMVNTAANNNTFLDITRANAKALGFSGIPAGPDANVTFTDFSDFTGPSSTLTWDFDASNGVSSGAIDFVGVALHEIGHALGFTSGVDTVDFFGSPNSTAAPLDLDTFAVFNTLDLFRFSDDSLAQPNQPAGGLRDLAYGSSGPGDNPFFSIDGGVTPILDFSTGDLNGDGRQASHWRVGQGPLLMNPAIGPGQIVTIDPRDILALDVIGYNRNRVPEPAALALVALVAAAFGSRRPGQRVG